MSNEQFEYIKQQLDNCNLLPSTDIYTACQKVYDTIGNPMYYVLEEFISMSGECTYLWRKKH